MAERAHVGWALLLAGFLVAVVVAVNWVSLPETTVDVQQFHRLMQQGLVARIGISGAGLRCRLERQVRLADDGKSITSQQLLVAGAHPSAGEVEGWKAAGITVEYETDGKDRGTQWLGLLVVVGLLGLGVGYLWSQARRYRQIGSPRQRLVEVEKEFADGKITLEEYQRRCEAILAEM